MPSVDESIVETLSTKFRTEIRELKELQEQNEKRRAEAREAEERQKREQQEKAAQTQQALLEQLLTAQVQEAEQKAKRDKILIQILGALLALITGGGGATAYMVTRQPTEDEAAAKAQPVVDTVEKSSNAMQSRVEKAEKKIERLGTIAVEQQVQLSDGIEYIGKKIDAAHPRTAEAVDEPPSVKAAKTKADTIKRTRGVEKLFQDEDPSDPFAGL